MYQFKEAINNLKKKPNFVFSIVSTMGFTLGALVCVLTLAYVMLIKPLPYPNQEKLVLVGHSLHNNATGDEVPAFTYPGMVHLYQNHSHFDSVSMIEYGRQIVESVNNKPTMFTAYVTPEWFQLLGVNMAVGRAFEASENFNTHNPVAVISYLTWQQEFAGDKSILDKKIRIEGRNYSIIGVINEGFVEPELVQSGLHTKIYLPFDFNSIGEVNRQAYGNVDSNLVMIARLKQGLTPSQATQSLSAMVGDHWKQQVVGDSFFDSWSASITVSQVHKVILGDSGTTVYFLIIGIVGLLLIALANIANLYISHIAQNHRALAIHGALGARPKDLFRLLLNQTNLLMVGVGLVALLVAQFGFSVMQTYLKDELPRISELSLNGVTIMSALVISVMISIVLATIGRRMINYKALAIGLKSSGKGTGIQVSQKLRKVLVVSQITIVTVLVFVNLSLFQSSLSVILQPLGVNNDNIYELSLRPVTTNEIPYPERVAELNELKKGLKLEPNIASVSQSSSPFGNFSTWATTIESSDEHFLPNGKTIDENYFQMLQQPLIEGRYLTKEDVRSAKLYSIVNETFAKTLNPEGSVVGMKLMIGRDPSIVVGVVKGMTIPGQTEVPSRVYESSSPGRRSFLIKFESGSRLSRSQIVSIVEKHAPRFAVLQFDSMNNAKTARLFSQYTTAITSALLAILTLVLAVIGLYGVLSYATLLRKFELGTRMAIGASPKQILAMVLKDNSRNLVIGLLVSVMILVLCYVFFMATFAPYLSVALIYIFIVTLLLVCFISLFACYWPLRELISRPPIYSLNNQQ